MSRGRRQPALTDVTERLNKTAGKVEKINEKISTRKRKLSLVLADLESYQDLLDNFDKWLKSTEKGLEAFKTLPLNSKDLSAMFAKFEVFFFTFFEILYKIYFLI